MSITSDPGCGHDSMDGIVASKGLWWCFGCERPVVAGTDEATGLSTTRLATYEDMNPKADPDCSMQLHDTWIDRIAFLEGRIDQLHGALAEIAALDGTRAAPPFQTCGDIARTALAPVETSA